MRTLIGERPWLLRVTRSLPGSRLTLTLIGSSFYPSELLSPLIGQHQVLQAGPRALPHRSVGPSRRGQSEQRGWSSREREGPAARGLSGSASERAAMILEEKPDGQGTSEDSSQQQDDGSIRKVGD